MTKEANEPALRVLILDDDPRDVRLLQDTLCERMNCCVTVLNSKRAFLAYLWQSTPDVVISDTNIPGFDGLKALALMQILHPGIPFVICSGNDNPELRAKALAGGAKAWVPKTNIQRLAAVVNQVCGPRSRK